MVLEIVIPAVLIVFAFDFFNGFHDAANAIATVVATKVLTPMRAVAMAAVGNFVGMVFITNAIAETVGKGIVDPGVLTSVSFSQAMAIVLAGVLGAIAWDVVTWWWGLPTSSSHALIGGLIGSTILASGTGGVLLPAWDKTALFFLLTGIAFGAGVAGYVILAALRKERPTTGAMLLAGLFVGLLPSLIL